MTEDKRSEQRSIGNATPEELVERVRERYGRIGAAGDSCCGNTAVADPTGITSEDLGYVRDDLSAAPEGADLSLGCGAPIPLLDLQPGETVVDLGSGGGLDAFLAARRVGPGGRVIGVDMTPEMIARARGMPRGTAWRTSSSGRPTGVAAAGRRQCGCRHEQLCVQSCSGQGGRFP